MSKDLARRTDAEIYFDGVDISASVRKYLIALTYTDYEEDKTDNLQIDIEDRDGVWLNKWLDMAIQAAASGTSADGNTGNGLTDWEIGNAVIVTGTPQYTSYGEGSPGAPVTNYKGTITNLNMRVGVPYPICVGQLGWFSTSQVTKIASEADEAGRVSISAVKGLSIEAKIIKKNWEGDGKNNVLDCGKFELDSIETQGPPAVISIKGTALPFNAQIRQTKKSKAWEAYTLSRIAKEMAAANGMISMFESQIDPYYARVEQVSMSDIAFLSLLCKNAGLSLKVTDNIIVIFDQVAYEAKEAVFTIKKGSGKYTKYKLHTGEADMKYASCRVTYVNPATGALIQGAAYAEDYDDKSKNNQTLEVMAKVSSIGEAQTLAKKLLRLKNKFEYTATFTLPGEPTLVSGSRVNLSGWGTWDGKYIISEAKHSMGRSGYVTQIKLRHVLEGY